MEHAVSLVQAYLQLNGYFTVAEYPVIAPSGRSGYRSVTDIDILAFRFPPSFAAAERNGVFADQPTLAEPDAGLGVPRDKVDLLIAEVKEGRVGINAGMIDEAVLKAVLLRFGNLASELGELVEALNAEGSVILPTGQQLRLVAFGAMPPAEQLPPCRIISLKHVFRFLQDYVRRNWKMLRQCQVKDPALGFLMTLEKARRGEAGRRGEGGVEVVSAAREDRRQTPRRHKRNPPAPRRPRPDETGSVPVS